MNEWQRQITEDKLRKVDVQMFSLEIDLKVALRIQDPDLAGRIRVEMARLEIARTVIKELLDGTIMA